MMPNSSRTQLKQSIMINTWLSSSNSCAVLPLGKQFRENDAYPKRPWSKISDGVKGHCHEFQWRVKTVQEAGILILDIFFYPQVSCPKWSFPDNTSVNVKLWNICLRMCLSSRVCSWSTGWCATRRVFCDRECSPHLQPDGSTQPLSCCLGLNRSLQIHGHHHHGLNGCE